MIDIQNTIKKKIKKISQKILIKINRMRLRNDNFTIISSNCIGGVIYHNLNKEFSSPTINLFIKPKDFVKFCSDLKFYLSIEPKEVKGSYEEYPLAQIGDITLHLLHYNSFNDFKTTWERRKKRVNFDNLFLIMAERDGCSVDDLLEFDKLPFTKVVFVHKPMKNIKSSFYVPLSEEKNDPDHKVTNLLARSPFWIGQTYLDHFDYVSFLNRQAHQVRC